MVDGFIQLPPDGTGKRVYSVFVTRNGTDYYMPATVEAELYTYVAALINSASAAGKNHIGLFNATGSGKVVKIRKVYVNSYITGTLTGAALTLTLFGTTGAGTGTAIPIQKFDTTSPALPAQITATHTYTAAPTIPANTERASITINNEESLSQIGKYTLFSQEDNIESLTLNEGQGMVIQQNPTLAGVGGMNFFIYFTVD